VDQQKLSQLGISIGQIAERIRAENINLSGGRLEEGNQRFLVRTLNEFQNIEEFRDAIVAYVADRPVYLRDVATVEQGYKDREAITRVKGQESVELAVYKEGDANTVQVSERIQRRLQALRESMPDDIELITIYDQSTFISAAVDDVRLAAILGGLIAIFVLYGFLRDARATMIVGIAIPVSVIGTFLLMYTNDISLNIMSMGGIALAVGMLVDNSIVVLENIVRKKEQGEGIVEAAQNGTAEVGSAVVAATLTTIAVFFPMVFISGIAGQLFKDQALTVTFALMFSLVVALTLIPMLASLGAQSRYDDGGDTQPANWFTRGVAFIVKIFGFLFLGIRKLFWALLWPATWILQAFYKAIAAVYPGILRWSLQHRASIILISLLLFLSTMALVPKLGSELIPQFSQGEFTANLRLPPGMPLTETDKAIQVAQRVAANIDAVELNYSVAVSRRNR